MRERYLFDRTGPWARVRRVVERNGGLEATRSDVKAIMVGVCLVGIVALFIWQAISGTLI